MSSLSMHALSLLTLLFSHFTFYFLIFFLFCLSSLFYLLSISPFFLCFLLFLLVVVHRAQLRLFYTACHDKIYRFTPKYFWPVMGVLPKLPTSLLADQPPPLPCASCAMFHSQTKGVLFYFLTFCGISIGLSILSY